MNQLEADEVAISVVKFFETSLSVSSALIRSFALSLSLCPLSCHWRWRGRGACRQTPGMPQQDCDLDAGFDCGRHGHLRHGAWSFQISSDPCFDSFDGVEKISPRVSASRDAFGDAVGRHSVGGVASAFSGEVRSHRWTMSHLDQYDDRQPNRPSRKMKGMQSHRRGGNYARCYFGCGSAAACAASRCLSSYAGHGGDACFAASCGLTDACGAAAFRGDGSSHDPIRVSGCRHRFLRKQTGSGTVSRRPSASSAVAGYYEMACPPTPPSWPCCGAFCRCWVPQSSRL